MDGDAVKRTEGTQAAIREAYCRGCAQYTLCTRRKFTLSLTWQTVHCRDCECTSVPAVSSPGICLVCGSANVEAGTKAVHGQIVQCEHRIEAKL
jgi:hypothetical protein